MNCIFIIERVSTNLFCTFLCRIPFEKMIAGQRVFFFASLSQQPKPAIKSPGCLGDSAKSLTEPVSHPPSVVAVEITDPPERFREKSVAARRSARMQRRTANDGSEVKMMTGKKRDHPANLHTANLAELRENSVPPPPVWRCRSTANADIASAASERVANDCTQCFNEALVEDSEMLFGPPLAAVPVANGHTRHL